MARKWNTFFVLLQMLISLVAPTVVIVDNVVIPGSPHVIRATMDPNVLVFVKFYTNRVHHCVVSANAQSLNCDLTGIATLANGELMIASRGSNCIISGF